MLKQTKRLKISVSTKDMLGIPNIKDVLRYSRLRWFGHLKRMHSSHAQKRYGFLILGANIRGNQKKWIHNVEKRSGIAEVKDMCSTGQRRMEKSNRTVSTTECCPTPNTGEPKTLNWIVFFCENN